MPTDYVEIFHGTSVSFGIFCLGVIYFNNLEHFVQYIRSKMSWQKGKRKSIIRALNSYLPSVHKNNQLYQKDIVNIRPTYFGAYGRMRYMQCSYLSQNIGLNILWSLSDDNSESAVLLRVAVPVLEKKCSTCDKYHMSNTLKNGENSEMNFNNRTCYLVNVCTVYHEPHHKKQCKKTVSNPELKFCMRTPPRSPDYFGPRTSTPTYSEGEKDDIQVHSSACDPDTQRRISDLEEQLEKLRKQIASIVSTKEGLPSGDAVVSSVPSSVLNLPPPPPPPPPPPLFLTVQPSWEGIKGQIMKNKTEKCENTLSLPQTVQFRTPIPNLSEVLKGMKNVKLRKVDRSPGGTPLRRAPLPSCDSDPAALIAAVLKRRISLCETPENFDSDTAWDSSTEYSPSKKHLPFGPHLLKPVHFQEQGKNALSSC